MGGIVRVATLNLSKGENRWDERAPLLIEQLVELRPDIIGVQEVDLRIDQGNWLCRRLNDLVSDSEMDKPEYTVHHMVNPRDRVTLEALAIMTRLPVRAHEGLDYLIRNRVAHRLRVEADGAPIDFYNTHFHHVQDPEGHEMRLAQSRKLIEWMDGHGWESPKVLVGDFNSLPSGPPILLIEETMRSTHEAVHGSEPHHTLTPMATMLKGHEPPSGIVVDYVFVSGEVRPLEAGVCFDRQHPDDPSLYASDHLGVFASIGIGPEKPGEPG